MLTRVASRIPSMPAETSIEAAKARIERLIGEIAALARSEITSEDFFQRYLEKVASACDAKGAALWVSAGDKAAGQLQLCAQVRFDSSLFQTDEAQRGAILRILGDVLNNRHSVVFSPESAGESAPVNGSRNKTPYPFVHVPILMKEQVVGVLQVWLQPYVQPANYPEFVSFLGQLTAYVDQHLQSRRLGNLVHETQRLHHLLRFASDIAGILDPLEAARYISNYGRDIVACERCSVLVREHGAWSVLSISGQEVVEKKSVIVKAMAAFVGAHAGETTAVLSKAKLLGAGEPSPAAPDVETAAPPSPTEAVDVRYFEHSHVVSAAVVPIHDPQKELVGALFFESAKEGYFEGDPAAKEPPASLRVAEWVGTHGGKALIAARDYRSLPLLRTVRALRTLRDEIRGDRRRRLLSRVAIWGVLLLTVALWPKEFKVEADCIVEPARRTIVVNEVPGRVERIAVRENDRVEAGQILAEFDTRRLRSELDATIQEKLRYLAEADRYRAAPLLDEAAAQVAALQARSLGAQAARIEADIAAATVRAPFAGVVLTKDVERRVGEFVEAGTPLMEVAALDSWELQVDVDERKIGLIRRALRDGEKPPVRYILYAQSAHTLTTTLEDQNQIGAMAIPRDRLREVAATASGSEKRSVFVITLPEPGIPEDIRPQLKPGLTGKAKIVLGHRPLSLLFARSVGGWFHHKFSMF